MQRLTRPKQSRHGGGGSANRQRAAPSQQNALKEAFFTDNPVPEDVEDDDDIARIMLDRLKTYRQNPMTAREIQDAQAKILDAMGDAPTDTRRDENSTQDVAVPFIVLCGKLADAVTPVHYKPSTASHKRIQKALLTPNADLAASILYTTGETVFAPIRYMMETNKATQSMRNDQSTLARSGVSPTHRIPVQQAIAIIEKATGFGLEGAIAAREQGVICLVFDHLDTARFAILIVLRVDKDTLPVVAPTSASILGDNFNYELFDASYLTREDTSDSPWAVLPAAYVDMFYFDRIAAPYGRLIADTRNS